MGLKERLKAESTEFGKLLKTWVAGFFTVCSAIGALAEYANAIPPTIVIPMWAKYVVFGAGALSYVYGHLTVKKPNEQV
jgi:hypothetical protein